MRYKHEKQSKYKNKTEKKMGKQNMIMFFSLLWASDKRQVGRRKRMDAEMIWRRELQNILN